MAFMKIHRGVKLDTEFVRDNRGTQPARRRSQSFVKIHHYDGQGHPGVEETAEREEEPRDEIREKDAEAIARTTQSKRKKSRKA
jgi:hypothetical protein